MESEILDTRRPSSPAVATLARWCRRWRKLSVARSATTTSRGKWVLELGGPGNPVLRTDSKAEMEEFLDWNENRQR